MTLERRAYESADGSLYTHDEVRWAIINCDRRLSEHVVVRGEHRVRVGTRCVRGGLF